jgi:hypothetical protein
MRGYTDMQNWMTALRSAVETLLAKRAGLKNRKDYAVVAKPCSKHGGDCVWVQYGALMDHLCWQEHDPCQLAEQVLATMLPPLG